jgi:hypothetical protein
MKPEDLSDLVDMAQGAPLPAGRVRFEAAAGLGEGDA